MNMLQQNITAKGLISCCCWHDRCKDIKNELHCRTTTHNNTQQQPFYGPLSGITRITCIAENFSKPVHIMSNQQ